MARKNFNMNNTIISSKHAFTLLELSVVIIIISIIIGGITVGTSLHKNYKLMTIISDAERFRMAMKNFKDQYQYYPGDFPRATAIWGTTTTPACNAGSGTSSTTLVSTTCNGSGNGVIGKSGAGDQELREKFFLWQHLNLSGYLSERYSGFAASGGDNYISPGINVPKMKYSKLLGYTLSFSDAVYVDVSTARTYPVQGKIGHVFSWSTPSIGVATTELINAQDAISLDKKMDDGLPFSGDVFAQGRDGTVDSCTTGNEYNASTSNPCGQYFRNFLEK